MLKLLIVRSIFINSLVSTCGSDNNIVSDKLTWRSQKLMRQVNHHQTTKTTVMNHNMGKDMMINGVNSGHPTKIYEASINTPKHKDTHMNHVMNHNMGQRMIANGIRSGHNEEEINRLKFIETDHHKHHSPCDKVKAIENSMCGVFHALSNKDESNTPQLIETNIDVTPKDTDEEHEGDENEIIPHEINKNYKIENKNKIETKKPEILNQNISQKKKEVNNANKKGVKPNDKKPPRATASHTIIKGIVHIKDKVIGLVTS